MLPNIRPDRGVALVAAVAITCLLTWPLAPRIAEVGRFDSDARHGIWNVTWVARALTSDPASLYQANIFHPYPNALAFTEPNIVAGVLGVPAWLITGDAVVTFNSAVLLAFVLSAISVYALTYYLTGSAAAGGLAAVVFAWSPYMFARLSHIQLLMTFGLPLTLLQFHRFADRPGVGRALSLGLSLVVTALSSGYYGILMSLVLVWGFIWYGIPDRLRDWRFWTGGALAAFTAALVVFPFYLPYLGVRADGFSRSLDDARLFSADWRAYLASAALAHRWLLTWIGSWQDVLFPGLVPLPLAAVALVWASRRRQPAIGPSFRLVGFYATAALFAGWVSFGPDAGLYRWLYDWVPVMSWLRAPGRLGVMVTLSVAVLGGIGLSVLARAVRYRRLAVAAVLALAVIESNVGPIALDARPVEPTAYRQLRLLPRGALLELPYYTAPADRHLNTAYMLSSTTHWQPILNGSNDYIPGDAWNDGLTLARFPDAESWQVLERRNARYILVHWGFYPSGTAPLKRFNAAVFDGYLHQVYSGEGRSLYMVLRWPPATGPVARQTAPGWSPAR